MRIKGLLVGALILAMAGVGWGQGGQKTNPLYGVRQSDGSLPSDGMVYAWDNTLKKPILKAITGAGLGDFSTRLSASVDGEIVLFSGTGGLTGKRATGTGIAKITSGVLGTATVWTDYAPGLPTAAATGTDTITATYSPAVTLVSGTKTILSAAGANTGAVTFAPNSLTAKAIVKYASTALVAGDIPASGYICMLEYNGTAWVLLNPSIETRLGGANAPSAVELAYVKSVTSSIQTQINAKATSATTLAGYGITDALGLHGTADLATDIAGTPGNSKYYGTNSGGTKGFYDLPSGGGVPTTITTANEATDTSCFVGFFTAATGDLGPKTNSGLTFNSSTSVLTATGFSGPLTGNVTGNASGASGTCTGNAGSATYASAATIVDDTTTAATMYPLWATAITGNLPLKGSSTKLSFVPSTGILTATGFAGALTGNVTGNASGSSGSCTGNSATATNIAGSPTASQYYGTDSGSTKGFYNLPTGGGVPTTITVANEASDATSFPLFATAATGDLGPKTNANFTFDASAGTLGVGNVTIFTDGKIKLSGTTKIDLAVAAGDLTAGTGISISAGSGTAALSNGGATITVTSAPTAALWGAYGTIAGPTQARTYTFPDSAATMLYSGGALGTPSGGTLTSCTGLPIAGLTASTSTALGVGSIELGHASDTTIARSGAGAITVEGVQVLLSGAALGTPASGTLTSCTGTPLISPKVGTIASSATPYPSTDGTSGGTKVHHFTVTTLAAAAQLQIPVGSWADGELLVVRIKGDATPRALTYVTSAGGYRAGDTNPGALPTTTTANKTLYLKFAYNSADSFFDFVGLANTF